MKTRRLPLLLAAALLIGVVGLAGFFSTTRGSPTSGESARAAGSKKVTIPAQTVAAGPVSTDELAQAAEVRLFFGHMSVGENILSGISAHYAANGLAQPRVVEFTVAGPLPQVPASGALVHAQIGQNGDPLGKLRNFDTSLRSGLADQVDVAVLKFCYIDFTTSTDVDQLFREYRKTLDALERDFPRVTFLHSTAPLMVQPSGWKENVKATLGGDDNVTRERYSALVREAYGGDHLFDIAAIEGTAPDGTRQPVLYSGYTSDGGHLNEDGSAVVSAGLLRLLAAARQSRGG